MVLQRGSFSQPGIDIDPSLMILDDPVRHGKTQAHASGFLFSGKERIEQPFLTSSVMPGPLSAMHTLTLVASGSLEVATLITPSGLSPSASAALIRFATITCSTLLVFPLILGRSGSRSLTTLRCLILL